jgi:hypothetical protein
VLNIALLELDNNLESGLWLGDCVMDLVGDSEATIWLILISSSHLSERLTRVYEYILVQNIGKDYTHHLGFFRSFYK